jgi:hypothetical protein
VVALGAGNARRVHAPAVWLDQLPEGMKLGAASIDGTGK